MNDYLVFHSIQNIILILPFLYKFEKKSIDFVKLLRIFIFFDFDEKDI